MSEVIFDGIYLFVNSTYIEIEFITKRFKKDVLLIQ